MVQIVLIRAGATDFDEQGRIQGTLDIPLSSAGKDAVARLSEQLRTADLDALYSASCQSAVETAEIIARELGVKAKKIDALKNVDHGLWQGMLVDEVRRKHPKVFRQWQEEPERVCPPEGEMVGEARQRIAQALKKVLKKHKKGKIGIVAPEPLASLIACYLTDTDLAHRWPTVNGHATFQWIVPETEQAIASDTP